MPVEPAMNQQIEMIRLLRAEAPVVAARSRGPEVQPADRNAEDDDRCMFTPSGRVGWFCFQRSALIFQPARSKTSLASQGAFASPWVIHVHGMNRSGARQPLNFAVIGCGL